MKSFICKAAFLFLILFSSPAWAVMTSGTTTSGTVPSGGSSSQSFTASVGQNVMLFASAGYQVNMNIYKPDGTLWTWGTDRATGSVPVTGTYNVVVTGNFSAFGPYSIAYLQGAGSVSNGTLTSGQTFTGTLPGNGIMSYQLTGSATQVVSLFADAAAVYEPVIYIYKPDGSYGGVGTDRLTYTLPSTGTYTVALTGYYTSNNGNYSLAYLRGGAGVSNGVLSSGTSVNNTLSRDGLDSYQFSGTAGQYFNLSASASYNVVFWVYKPDGSYFGNGTNRYSNALPTTGTYTVATTGYYNTYSGPYRLDYVMGSRNVADGMLVSGATRSGNLPTNGLDSYQFTGTSGNIVSITTTGGYNKNLYIYKPDGTYLSNNPNALTTTLTQTGTHTLVVYGVFAGDSGLYFLSASTPPTAVATSTATKVDTNSCSVGNPINYDVGFKFQNATDYNVGGLTFTRIYRSDSTWTDNTIGNRWRHNYARTLTLTSSSASLTDGTGATTQFTSAGGLWVPTDASTTATLFTSGSNYLYTLQDNTVETYSSANKLTRISYLGGGALNLSYNSSGLLATVANENLRQMTLTYGSTSRVATLTTPDGAYAYAYDPSGNLAKVTKPNTKFTQYHYENATYVNALTGITDESGIRFASFTYDASGRGTLTQHAGPSDNYTINYASSSAGAGATTNPLGSNSTYNFINYLGVRKAVQVSNAASANVPASTLNYNYDNQTGWVIGKTDAEGNNTRYQYDARGNITQIVKGTGTPQQAIRNITYSSAYNLPLTDSETGKTTTYVYDTYGRVTSVAVTDLATAETRTTTYTYYANSTDGSGNLVLGRLNTVDGPRTDVSDITTYYYDANLNLNKIRNALSQDTQILTRDAAGRPTKIQDPNGINTALTYNSSGLLGTLIYASGTGLAATTSYIYNPNNDLTQVTLPNGVITKYTYDSAHRVTGITDGLNNTITYTLNAAGNVTQEQYKTGAAVLKYTHKQTFDELARLIQDVGASNQISFTSYDKNSNVNRYQDQNANATKYAYDPLIRFISSTNALNGNTQLQYTSLSALKSVTDPRTNTTTYTYNAFGDVTSEVSPDRGTIQYSSYDGAGNLKISTDARGIVTNYAYDALNRITSIAYPSSSTQNATLTYDSASGIGCGTAGIGHLCFTSDTGRTAYQYNALGQLTYTSESRGAVNFTTTYAYDGAGFLTGITLPSGRTIAYSSNANGQVSSVVAKVNGSNVTLASSIVYLPFGPLTTMTYGNGKTFTGTYNQDYNPTNFTVSSIYSNTLIYDSASNIIQMSSGTYGYDALLRMSSESGTLYTYDATSNRTAKGGTSVTVPSTSNKISAVGANALTYDSAGNILTYNGNAYTWNAANQLSFVSTGGSTVGTYTYNYLNQRTKKVAGATTTFYVYGLNGQLYGEYTSAGALVREYVYLNGNPLAQVNAGSPETATWLHTDQLGTPRFGTNSSGTQVWAWNSDAFGNGTPTGSVTVNLRLPGQYFDSESGLFYNWNRYYSPALGRYITSDPIGLNGGLNTFNYVGQNPLMYSDMLGLLDFFTRNAVPQSVVNNAQNTVGRICNGALNQDEVKKATSDVMKNISLPDALSFAAIDPNGKPIVLNKDQDQIVREQINQLKDSSIKEKAQKAYDEAKQKGTVVVK